MDANELQALGYSRGSKSPYPRFEVALLLDQDYPAALEALRDSAASEMASVPRWIQPGNAGNSPCGYAQTAAEHALAEPPTARRFDDLMVAFEPRVADVRYRVCSPRAVPVALAVLGYLAGDDARAARQLVRARPVGVLDELATKVTSLVVRGRGGEVAAALRAAAPGYVAAMGRGLWRDEPGAFVHLPLLAVLLVAAERGAVDLAALPDEIEYAPIAFLHYLRTVGHCPV